MGVDWHELKSQSVKIDENYKQALQKKQRDVEEAMMARIRQMQAENNKGK